jgi:hypothetical protein
MTFKQFDKENKFIKFIKFRLKNISNFNLLKNI